MKALSMNCLVCLFACVACPAQGRIVPPKAIDSTVRAQLFNKYYPAPPAGVLTLPWDSIYAIVDKYTGVRKLTLNERRELLKGSWFALFDSTVNVTPKYLGIAYNDCRIRRIRIPSPAYAEGVCQGDSVLRVNGQPVLGKDSILRALVDRIADDDVVRLDLMRGDRILRVSMVRAELPTSFVFARRESRTVFVRISQFGEGMADEFDRKVGGSIGYNGVDSMVIDLRGNPGGRVWETLRLLRMFCRNGDTLWKEISRTDTVVEISYRLSHPLMKIPTIVLLVDSASASASEAFTGCLKVRRGATVLGTRTFGKGIVQTTAVLEDMEFRVTTAEYLAGGVMKIHKVGVQPDGPVPAWLQKEPSCINDKTAGLDMKEVRIKFPYPHELALKELALDWSQATYIWGDQAEVYYTRPASMAKR